MVDATDLKSVGKQFPCQFKSGRGHQFFKRSILYFAIKTLLTALIIASISELAKRYSLFAAALASLPLTSILAFLWLYHDTQDINKIAELSYDILWMVIPSLIFFVIFPLLLKHNVTFYPALIFSCLTMSVGYGIFLYVKKIIL